MNATQKTVLKILSIGFNRKNKSLHFQMDFFHFKLLKICRKKTPTMLFHSLVEDCALGVLLVNKSFWGKRKICHVLTS